MSTVAQEITDNPVIVGLAEGKTPTELAELLGVPLEDARKRVKSVLQRTETKEELVAYRKRLMERVEARCVSQVEAAADFLHSLLITEDVDSLTRIRCASELLRFYSSVRRIERQLGEAQQAPMVRLVIEAETKSQESIDSALRRFRTN